MSERACMADCAAYLALQRAFTDPRGAVENMRRDGRKTVWMFGDDVPEEIILAAGMHPVRLLGEYGTQENADHYLEASFGSLWRGAFERLVNGSYAGQIDYITMSNSSDMIQKLYYYLLELGKMEPQRKLAPIYYIDYSLMVKDFSAQERNIRETKAFLNCVEQWTGAPVSRESLRAAIELCNEHRAALREISRLRRVGKISGSEALQIIGGSFFLEKRSAIALLRELTTVAEQFPDVPGIRAVYTGSAQETAEVYTLFEENGINIVADDKLLGDRYSDCDVSVAMEPGNAIALRYHLRTPSSERGFVAERAIFIPELVQACNADALVIFMNQKDESYIWDYPKQRERLEKTGVQTLMIEKQRCPLADKSELAEIIREFAHRAGGERQHG